MSSEEFIQPFFSIVIACYNDGRYTKGTYLDRLLSNLAAQDIDRNDLQVIIVDDQSPVELDDIVEPYEDKLNIIRAWTEYNFAPGNTRQCGVDCATGQWLCFADHDDIFCKDAFKEVKKFIETSNEAHFVYTPFYGVDLEGNIIRKYENTRGWCHGKFYNLENFWKAQGIHFLHDLASHEDIAICTQVDCALYNLNERGSYFDFPTYAWTDNPQSVSHVRRTASYSDSECNFLELYFSDYIKATGYIYADLVMKDYIPTDFAIESMIQVLCYLYMYMQGFQTEHIDYLRINEVYAGQYVAKLKHLFGMKDNSELYNIISKNNCEMYYEIRQRAEMAVRFIPQKGLKQWMDDVENSWYEYCKFNLQLLQE